MQLATTGISNLDRLFGGGLPREPDIVVSGSKEDLHLFSQYLLWTRLNAGDLCLYGTVSETVEGVQADLALKGWDVSPFIERRILRIVDFLSLAEKEPKTPEEKWEAIFSIGEEGLAPERIYQVLAKEFHGLRGIEPNRRFVAILDSVDMLIGLMGMKNALHYKEMMLNLLKDTNSLGVALLCNEFFSGERLETIKDTASIFIELKQEQKEKKIQRMIRVTKPEDLSNDWMPFSFGILIS